jgi:hypothetical protein
MGSFRNSMKAEVAPLQSGKMTQDPNEFGQLFHRSCDC